MRTRTELAGEIQGDELSSIAPSDFSVDTYVSSAASDATAKALRKTGQGPDSEHSSGVRGVPDAPTKRPSIFESLRFKSHAASASTAGIESRPGSIGNLLGSQRGHGNTTHTQLPVRPPPLIATAENLASKGAAAGGINSSAESFPLTSSNLATVAGPNAIRSNKSEGISTTSGRKLSRRASFFGKLKKAVGPK
jgi:hypothetical protein